MGRTIVILFLAYLCPLISTGQDFVFEADFQSYSDAIYSQKLVRNHGQAVPLQRLDTLRLATWFGRTPLASIMREVTDQYLPAHHFDDLSKGIGDANVIILGLGRDHGLTVETFRSIVSSAMTIAIVYDRVVYEMLPLDATDAVIHAFDEDSLNYHVCVQQIFGGAPFGVYSVALPDIDRLGFAPPAAVGIAPGGLFRIIDSIALTAIDSGAAPGIQVLAARRGKVFYQKTYGHHTYDQHQPVRTSDLYDLASITKVTSGLPALMRLYAEGRFDLEATVADYLPEFAGTDKADLRWRDILAHNARLQPWIPYWENTLKKNGKFKWGTFKTKQSKRFPVQVTGDLYLHRNYRKKIYQAIIASPLNDESGFVYSGLAFYLMPELVETLSGVPLEQLIKTDIYRPLGARSITYNPLRYYRPEEIIPTEDDTFFRMTQLHGRVHDEGASMMGGVSCNAGLFATTIDLAKMAQMYLNNGTYGDAEIIPEEVVAEFTRCQFCRDGNHRGLGFDKPMLTPEEVAKSTTYCASVSRKSFGHSGYTGTLMWVDPAEELVFIFMSNRVYPTRLNRKLYEMKVRPAIHQALYDAIRH